MDLIWIVIAGSVIISIISAVSKNKKREEAQREQQAGQRPMSDIQRAAMMAQETASQRPAVQPRPAQAQQYGAQPNPVYAQQYAQPRPSYAPQQPAAYTPVQARTAAPMEARTAAPMQARSTAPLEARTAAPMQARPMGAVPPAANGLPANFYSGSMSAATNEGWSSNTDDDKPMELLRASEVESVSDADLETVAGSRLPKPQSAAAKLPTQQAPLRLFDGKNELVRAVIYSEVLARRTPGRRPGRA